MGCQELVSYSQRPDSVLQTRNYLAADSAHQQLTGAIQAYNTKQLRTQANRQDVIDSSVMNQGHSLGRLLDSVPIGAVSSTFYRTKCPNYGRCGLLLPHISFLIRAQTGDSDTETDLGWLPTGGMHIEPRHRVIMHQ